jgi:hypothetical protein
MTYISETLRQQITSRARKRCEYCRLHELATYYKHEIDHIYAEKHGGNTVESNLCLACGDCNRYKGSDLCSLDPETDTVVSLLHPRRDKWNEHFRLNNIGMIEPLTPTGRATERILRFNRIHLVEQRQKFLELGFYDEN